MFPRSIRLLRLVSAVAVVALGVGATATACGTPTDPGAPVLPDAVATTVIGCFGAPDGTACSDDAGTTGICVRGVCAKAACGDGVVTPPEECDNGSTNGPGTGCESDCRFTCLSADTSRNCGATDTGCIAAGTCDDVTHTCKAGGPKPAGAGCGPGKFCRGAECVAGACGDAVVTAPEQCDNGSANGAGTGCEASCTFSCSDPATCPAVPCAKASCTADHRCGSTPDSAANGQSCGSNLFCHDGACLAPGAVCGNGVVEGGEDCDFGTGNGPGTGCETTCRASCTSAPGSCVDMNPCHAAPSCDPVTVNGSTGHKCVAGATKSDGSVCGTGSICLSGTCKPSFCGDGFRDDARTEQCDDGNVTNLDACSSQCLFEQDQRVISMKMQFGIDAFCTINALGASIGALARGTFQDNIDSSILDGSVSPLFTFAGDLAGASGPATVGNLSGTPTSTAPPYDGTKDLDWWYTATPSSIDGNRAARATLTGAWAGGTLSATGRLNLIASIGGAISSLAVSGAKIQMPSSAVTTPLSSAAGAPPGHLAGEHLVSTLQSFSVTGGTALKTPTAQMCGNILASSLDATAPPTSLLPGGSNACTEKYSANNRMIDIIVHGCHVTALSVVAIKPTQPDQIDPSAPAAGAGPPYTFLPDATTKRVTACHDKSGGSPPLAACLAAAAYSMSFKYATDRVIIK